MNTRNLMMVAVLSLVASFGCVQVNIDNESNGGAGGTGTSSGSDIAPDACGLALGYTPNSASSGPLVSSGDDLGGVVAVVLPPFDVDTDCKTVVVGFTISPDPCELPAAIDIVSFDTEDPMLAPVPTVYAVVPLSESTPLGLTAVPNVFEVRLPVATSHTKDSTPIVGAVARKNLCPAVMPLCEDVKALRYRAQEPAMGWHPLSETLPGNMGTNGTLYFGLADCSAH